MSNTEGYKRAPAIALLFSFAYKLSARSKYFLTLSYVKSAFWTEFYFYPQEFLKKLKKKKKRKESWRSEHTQGNFSK